MRKVIKKPQKLSPSKSQKVKEQRRPSPPKPQAVKEVLRLEVPPEDYDVTSKNIPFLEISATPRDPWRKELLKGAERGLGVEVASAYASVPAPLVRNWLARGRQEELKPCTEKNEYYKKVTVPCFDLWVEWKKLRARFIAKLVDRVAIHGNWQAQAWLLERLEPSIYLRPATPSVVKRELQWHEHEVEAALNPDNAKVVEFYVPDNGRI